MDIELDIFGQLLILKDQEVRPSGALETYCTRCGYPFPTGLRNMPDGKVRSIPQCGDCRHRYARRPKPSQRVLPLEVPAELELLPNGWRVGQRVRCVEGGNYAETPLVKGRFYTVVRIPRPWVGTILGWGEKDWVQVAGFESKGPCLASRFRAA